MDGSMDGSIRKTVSILFILYKILQICVLMVKFFADLIGLWKLDLYRNYSQIWID